MTTPPRPTGRAAHLTVLALLAASLAAGIVGNAFLPLLLRESPVLLLAVQSSYQQMALTSPRVDPEILIAVATTRRWVGELIAYAAGRVFGADAIAWFSRRRERSVQLPTERSTGWQWTRDLVVLVVSHPVVSASAGMLGMPWLRFAIFRLIGGLGWVVAVWYLAGELAVPLGFLVTAIEANAAVLTALGVIATVGLLAWRYTQRRSQRAGRPERPRDVS